VGLAVRSCGPITLPHEKATAWPTLSSEEPEKLRSQRYSAWTRSARSCCNSIVFPAGSLIQI
jgi:hypothetical protein